MNEFEMDIVIAMIVSITIGVSRISISNYSFNCSHPHHSLTLLSSCILLGSWSSSTSTRWHIVLSLPACLPVLVRSIGWHLVKYKFFFFKITFSSSVCKHRHRIQQHGCV